MKLKDYLENINKMVQNNPEILELDVIYAKDDEGNYYDFVTFIPTIGHFGWANCDFINELQFDEFNENLETNAICIN
jgi:hypothetical protein